MLLIMKEKVALITGSSRGIGKAISIKFARMKIKVVLNYRKNEDEALKTLNEIKNLGAEAIVIRTNVSKEEEVKRMIKEAKDNFGEINILVNNAALGLAVPFKAMSFEIWYKQIDVSLNGIFFVTKEVVNDMISQKWGRIINMSSIAGINGLKYLTAYSAAKGGIIGFTKALASELAEYNITVNAIAPAFVETDMGKSYFEWLEKRMNYKQPLIKYLNYFTTNRKLITPEEVAEFASFLVSDNASGITGQVFTLESGFNLQWYEALK